MKLLTRSPEKNSIWTDAREVPTAAVAPPARVERRARWLRFALRASVVLLPVTLIALILVLGSRGRSVAVTGAEPAPNTQGRAAATLALQAWLAGDPDPLPGGGIVSWDGAVANTPPTVPSPLGAAPTAAFPTQRDLFTVVDGSGRLFRAEMLMALDPSGGAKALAGPSLTPVPDARATGAGDEYSAWGWQPVAVPAPVESAVRAWGKAFTSGDATALRLAVGDKDPGHAYLPLPTPQSAIVAVRQGAFLPASGEGAAPTQMLVRVRLTVDYHPAVDGGDQQNPPPLSFDVLVDGADTAAPNVVAWGGPGSGPALTAHGNAVPADAPTSPASPPAAPSATRPPTSPNPTPSRPAASTSPAPPG